MTQIGTLAQLPQETHPQYIFFLVYCQLGPKRNIEKARKKLVEDGRRPGDTKAFHEIARINRWDERARDYDIATIYQEGGEFMVEYAKGMALAAKGSRIALETHKPGSKQWWAAVKTLESIGGNVPQALVQRNAGVSVNPTIPEQLSDRSGELHQGSAEDPVDVGSDTGDSQSSD